MKTVVVTGSNGLIGSEAVRFFDAKGFRVIGIDNNMREYFFGPGASTLKNKVKFERELPSYRHHSIDIRDEKKLDALFAEFNSDIVAVIHTAAQPSHDWAAREPLTDFTA